MSLAFVASSGMFGNLRQKFAVLARDNVSFFGVTMIALLWVVTHHDLERDRTDDIERAALNTSSLARHFEESTLHVIKNADRVLKLISDRLGHSTTPAAVADLLKQAASVSDITFQLAIIDAKGILRYSSITGENTKPIDLNDREHFQVHVNAPHDQLFISKPVLGRASSKWSIQLTRKLRDGTGAFAGVIVLSLDPIELSRPFDNFDLGPRGLIMLVGTDGIVRARSERSLFAMNDGIKDSELGRTIFSKAEGTLSELRFSDDVRRLMSFRKVREIPIVVAVAMAEDDILADYRDKRVWQLAAAAVLTLVIAIAVGLSATHRARLQTARLQIYRGRRREQKKTVALQTTLDNMAQGIIMVGSDRTVNVINKQATDLLGLTQRFLQPGYQFDELIDHLVARGEYDGEGGKTDLRLLESVRCSNEAAIIPRFERRRSDGTVLEIRTKALPDGGFVRTITDITQRRNAELKLMQLARQDSLTVLANRGVLREELDRLLSDGSAGASFAVHCIDLDRFKTVNDTLGHPVGDRLLQLVADRLRKTVRAEDLVARLGGDEFAIIQRQVASTDDSAALAGRIVRVLSEPFDIDGQPIVVGASVGIVLAPRDGKKADDLLKNADMALYRAKSAGRGTHCFFVDEMREEAQARRSIEVDLRAAVIEQEFELHYQPLIGIQSGLLNGFEVLIRWRHPVKGMIPPLDFIPIAEDLKLITSIGAWVINEACRRAATWPRDLKVAVNLSPVQFESGDVVRIIRDALSASGLEPSRLELEITESALLNEDETTLAKLRSLRDLGVRIAMDDFGTGYSALNYLLRYPFDKIKIDRTFVKGLGTAVGSDSIVGAIVELAHKLGMSTTGEGVETSAQLSALTKLQCDEVQGYLFSAPRPLAEVDSMIAKFAARSRAA